MKNKFLHRFKYITLVIVVLAFFSSCTVDKNDPGRDYMGKFDMYYTKFYKAFTPNKILPHGQTNQAPPKGTVPRGHKPFPLKGSNVQERLNGQTKAGEILKNPLKPTKEVIAEGKRQFNIFCADCHGKQGKGDGHLYTAGLYPAKPTSLVDNYVQSKPDGEIFYVITKGSISGLMPGHEIQIKPENRWKIIHYLRTLAK